MANPEPAMSSSRKAGRVASNSRRHAVLAGDLLPRGPRAPHAQEPDPVEPQAGHAVELGVGHVVQRGGPTERARPFGEPNARVELVERGIAWRAHVSGSDRPTAQPAGA